MGRRKYFFFLEHAKQRAIFIEKKAQEVQVHRGNKNRDPTEPKKRKGKKGKKKGQGCYIRAGTETKSGRRACRGRWSSARAPAARHKSASTRMSSASQGPTGLTPSKMHAFHSFQMRQRERLMSDRIAFVFPHSQPIGETHQAAVDSKGHRPWTEPREGPT
ncbi:hypothetical protein BRADI_2g47406v3 [Brachypodium distachyon]|uniref:Uncharacterized protein n=1 Tax=Brachypodium distachyon TaxID=15368 RepID=A0A2K2DEC2_BRADI|nr:hypothetical protein BRADI_2g47406v3 [Brachypodium distachyon]